jgi:KUP system potassium uptake protein
MADEASPAPVGGAPTPTAHDAAAAPVTPVDSAHADGHAPDGSGGHGGFWALTVGAIGVVFGDIGTSPLYAMREALHNARHGEHAVSIDLAALGVVSLILWTLTLFVTIKYVIFLMRADNNGEGGTLALMALARKALGQHMGKRATTVFFLGVVGAALFYGDGIITPAISVLSAVEGIKDAPTYGHFFKPYVLPISAGILIALFLVQAKGTQKVANFFGPITAVWFVTLGVLGVYHISDNLSIFRALNPWYGVKFLLENGFLGFVILGSVFLAVTGAEALYADMGHFGKKPIRVAWLALIFPCLTLNYLGQGALVLKNHDAAADPFFAMVPQFAYWPVLILATAATVIASQAVITGAFSMTQQAVQLGLLPRMDIKRTSETQAGQIFVPSVNQFLMIGVLVLLVVFRSSHRLASAYGIAVTGSMFVDTLISYVVIRRVWNWRLWQAALLLVPLVLLDSVFIASNLLKIPEGAWMPLAFGMVMVVIMWTWTRGSGILTAKTRRDSVPLAELMDILRARAPHRVPGTAIFLTSDPDVTPVALMHNLKHNKVMHERNVVMTVRTASTPRVREEDRVKIDKVSEDFKKVYVTYGFMESPNLPKALNLCRKQGLKFDIMATSFFLGRRSLVPSAQSGMPMWQDKLFIFLMKNATNPTDFFKIPPGRVVELGAQVTV